MKKTAWLTTSWDDGHPLDFKVADLLSRYGLTGTFYIPPAAPTGTMSAQQVRELSTRFEIGSHTMNHVFLDGATDEQARREIVDSKAWVEETTGSACPMFCPPGGKFASRDLDLMREAGYSALRSVELVSLDHPRDLGRGLWLLPTTIHSYPQPVLAYYRNFLKRRKLSNLWNYILHGHGAKWTDLAGSLLEHVARQGGVFHLWGHSWELEETRQWRRLEQVLCIMGQYARRIPCLTNGEMIRRTLAVAPAPKSTSHHPDASAPLTA